MTYFKDLSPYSYFKYPQQCAGEQVNVGWLDREAPYLRGNADPDLIAKLLALCKWPVKRTRGWHNCHFCREYPVRVADSDGRFCLGDGEIRVPGKDGKIIYAAPNLIYHYVVTHRYLPPAEFLEALRDMALPNPAVVWILEYIEDFQHGPVSVNFLWQFMAKIAGEKKPALPPELRTAVLQAVDELKIADKTLGRDAKERAESTVAQLKSTLT